jgi:hypothetical protein
MWGHLFFYHYSMAGVGSQSYFSITTILFEILLTGFIFLRSFGFFIHIHLLPPAVLLR